MSKVTLPPAPLLGNAEDQLVDWEQHYRDVGITPDFSGIIVPPKRVGFDRLIPIPAGMAPQMAFDVCARDFRCWKYTDGSLDDVIVFAIDGKPERFDRAVAFWVRDRIEADEEHASKSANVLVKGGIQGIMLTPRLLLEDKYFRETGKRKHLDVENITLCAGSRDSDGDVSDVSWNSDDDEMYVSSCDPVYSSGRLRARGVVS